VETPRFLENRVEMIEPEVRREILILRGREGLKEIPFDPFVVKNQEQFGKTVDNAVAMAEAHAKYGDEALGVRETTTRRFNITVDGEIIQANEANPKIVNKWISYKDMPARFLTPEQASNTQYSGRTALDWATRNGKTPERVVVAGDRYYPATNRDVIVPTEAKILK
jgi:hypothetical protein